MKIKIIYLGIVLAGNRVDGVAKLSVTLGVTVRH